MPKPKIKTAASDALVGLWTIGLIAFVIAALYLTRDLLIPLALAALLTFLLSPLVGRVERWIGRIAAVLMVVVLIFAALGGAGWMVTHQLIDLATKLPQYKGNISQKLHAFQAPRNGTLTKINETVHELKKELPGNSPAEPTVTQEVGKPETAVASPPSPLTPAVPVKVIETSKANPFELIQTLITPLLGPLGAAALVLLLVIFMLFEREDLRNRLIRLIGQGRISATTRAMDEAADRVSRYLRMQLFVNVCYGTCIGIGLYFIGVPNALLWGALGTVLRFIPYVGVWIATLLPTLLAIAVSPHWMMPLLTLAVCGGVEVVISNAVEPLLYGKQTGVSSIALIIAAVFWTWLWGPLGLIMATPLTVCLVVMGRHVPRMSFLSIILSDEEALTPAEECYHRLLTAGEQDETELVETYLKTNSLIALYDSVLIPVITAAETDARQESLDREQLAEVKRNLRDMLDDLASRPQVASDIEADKSEQAEAPVPAPGCRVCCVPARGERDELAGSMLVQLLGQQHFEAQNAPAKMDAGELFAFVEKADPEIVVVSVVAPSTVIHARYLSVKLRARFPLVKIIVGLWGTTAKSPQVASRLRDSGADEVAVSLADAMAKIAKFAQPITGAMMPAPMPDDEERRLAALEDLQLLDTESEVIFDRITAKLARIFEVPIALLTLVGRDRQFFKSATGLPEDLAKARQTARDVSVCGHVVASNQVMVIEDLLRDRRFANNPFLKERGLRFYAGVPVRASNGQPIGSLCILDTRPRQLTAREKRLLEEYANEVTEEVGRRSAVIETAAAA
jgi:predicted PurR-regulated permease PerM